MKTLASLSILAIALVAASPSYAGEQPEVVCRMEVVDARSGEQAVICRYRATDGTGKEIMIEDMSLQGDVGAIGVAP